MSSIAAIRRRVSTTWSSNVSWNDRLLHVSARRAACRIITGPRAPIVIGGRGDWMGRGFMIAPATL